MRLTRRRFGTLAAGGFACVALEAACGATEALQGGDGRLTARPRTPRQPAQGSGGPLGLDADRDATLRLPPDRSAAPLPLLVYLHGATQRAEGMLRRIGSATDAAGIAVLAPDSRETTWDAIRGGYGRDIQFLDRALERVFDSVAIDPARVAIGGFSDGATYALSLALINGDLFTHAIANSPGFVIEGRPQGKARFFVSHGTADQILPIDQCSRTIVPALRRAGYDVTYQEFAGRHEIPAEIAAQAMRWFVDRAR